MQLRPWLLLVALTAACSGKPKERAGEKAACDGQVIKPSEVTLSPGETTTFVVSNVDGTANAVDLDWEVDRSAATITADGRFIAPPQLGDVKITVRWWRIQDDSGPYARPSNGKRYDAICYLDATAHIVPTPDAGGDGGADASDGSSDSDAADGGDAPSEAGDAADAGETG